jgi:tripartite-type tricarboxylate transporter receptor subunit TctC
MSQMRCMLGAMIVAFSCAAAAQTFPSKTVRFIVPYAPGGETDALGRIIAPRLSEKWKQSVVVENRVGGGTVIGTEAAAKADPDGHTLLIASVGFVTNQILIANLPYDPASLLPQVLLSTGPLILYVNASVPAKTLKEFVAYGKARPRELMFASSGNASSPHITAELFASMTGIEMTHVPYKGTGPAMTDLMGGQVHALFGTMTFMPNARAGKVRALAVANKTRLSNAPDLPTAEEAGLPNFTAASWFGVFAQAGVPADVRQRIYTDVRNVAETAEIRERIQQIGLEPSTLSREEYAAFLKEELEKWGGIIRAKNIKLE